MVQFCMQVSAKAECGHGAGHTSETQLNRAKLEANQRSHFSETPLASSISNGKLKQSSLADHVLLAPAEDL